MNKSKSQLEVKDYDNFLIKFHFQNIWKHAKDNTKEFREKFQRFKYGLSSVSNLYEFRRSYTTFSSRNSSRPCNILFLVNFIHDNIYEIESIHIQIIEGLIADLLPTGKFRFFVINNTESRPTNSFCFCKIASKIDASTYYVKGNTAFKNMVIDNFINYNQIDLIATIGGYYEAFHSSLIAEKLNIKTLLLQSNQNYRPITNYDLVIDFNDRTYPKDLLHNLNDIANTLHEQDKSLADIKVCTAMRNMQDKISIKGNFVNFLQNYSNLPNHFEWTLIGVDDSSELAHAVSNFNGIYATPNTVGLDEFSKLVAKFNIFYFPDEFVDGSVGTIAAAYFLGLIIIVDKHHPCWGQLPVDEYCVQDFSKLDIIINNLSLNMPNQKFLAQQRIRNYNDYALQFSNRMADRICCLFD